MYTQLMDHPISCDGSVTGGKVYMQGIEVLHEHQELPGYARRAAAGRLAHWLQGHGLDLMWLETIPTATGWHFRLTDKARQQLTPDCDTLSLHERLGRQRWTPELEIVIALLATPVKLTFPTFDELCAHVDVRKNICLSGSRTTLAFATATAERPAEYWSYAEETGFTLKPCVSLIDALIMATQPAASGGVYSFSCYRATEYVMLLGIAQTLQAFHPELLSQLESQWRTQAIASGRFHDTFLTEIGSLDQPLPMPYYVPGDRVWFRNPDEASSDVVGFEGSWVVYLGQGRFTDFWRPGSVYSMADKCLEIYFWRHAIAHDADGEAYIDEEKVWANMAQLEADATAGAARKTEILTRMMRYRDGRGVYADGGCIDATREHPRCLCPGTYTLDLPQTNRSMTAPAAPNRFNGITTAPA
ncbi:MAG TPA: hypothetical protein PK347_01985 [Burkholderiaceae bacterium]|nr:hypothetical protein [Burkholderiaceae bacterium]